MIGALRILIVDDEPLAARRLERLCLRAMPDARPTSETSGRAALANLDQNPADVMLLDIDMPGLSGLATAELAARVTAAPSIVFTTAHERFAVEAFAVGAVDYLLKPVTLDRLCQALERVSARHGAPADAKPRFRSEFWVRDGGDMVRIDADRIEYVSAEGDYMRLHLAGQSYLLHSTLSQLERELDATAFLRVHRSALVAKRSIAAVGREASGKWIVRLRSGGEVGIGESYMASVRALVRG
ncbi:LytR/AlgR family response regulator transcription factor [Sphingomonas sp. PAMC 26605]|uniref:LytR/AlgR family response regulator transcription factor n=1 Tax=Sphingomonas sp. PAMC 26605 TaxID=1112214 RepID=UPI00026CC62E|nr:LytTR family DNA-binding domain-containing protein [Sphingomonas sp. PAMC 26605]